MPIQLTVYRFILSKYLGDSGKLTNVSENKSTKTRNKIGCILYGRNTPAMNCKSVPKLIAKDKMDPSVPRLLKLAIKFKFNVSTVKAAGQL